MTFFLFHPSAGAFNDMIMASLLDLEVSRQERSSIVACLAAVTSDKLFHS